MSKNKVGGTSKPLEDMDEKVDAAQASLDAMMELETGKMDAVMERSALNITQDFSAGRITETAKSKDLQLGELAISYVGLRDLRNFWKNDSPENLKKLIDPQKAFVIPLGILEKEKGEEFVVMIPSTGKTEKARAWRISQLGPLKDFQAIEKARLEVMEKKYNAQGQKCACFMIWVPSVKQYFLGDQTSGKLEIILLRNGPGSFKKGERLSARAVFKELAKEAVSGKYDYPPFNPTKPNS